MVTTFEALFLILSVAAIASITRLSGRQMGARLAAIALMLVMVVGFSSPAQAAAGAKDAALSPDQKELNETLEQTPNGNQLHGVEYAEAKGTPLSDSEIERRIREDVSDEIATSVSNGAVRISGQVRSKSAAQQIVSKVKDIPGVHEITFDLGLEKINTNAER